jgi:hypothetical protein
MKGQFFIYGGLLIDVDKAKQLNDEIFNIRKTFGYAPGDDFKFTNQSGVAADTHASAKSAALAAMDNAGAKFAVTVVLEMILRNTDDYLSYAINVMTAAFHEYLRERDDSGAMFIDRVEKTKVTDEFTELARRFQLGLAIPDGYSMKVNDRILLFGMTNNNSSHLSSCADIALGSFRYCVNAATGHAGAKDDVAKTLMLAVDKLIWRSTKPSGEEYRAGFRPYPLTINSATARNAYEALRQRLGEFTAKPS